MHSFQWIPGQGIDATALARMRAYFGPPDEPMGEAWFIGERRMFDELVGDLDRLTPYALIDPLVEIASGTGSFGPQEEWNAWFHYLLPRVVARGHEEYCGHYVLETLITALVALYPNGMRQEPYPGFCDDVLLTIGRSMMDPQCWDGEHIVVNSMLKRWNNTPAQLWFWGDASGDLSASLFLCLKYLPDTLVESWLHSVLAIPSPHWRAQIIVWLVGADDLLHGKVKWPEEFALDASPSIAWDWSHCIRLQLTTWDKSGGPVVDALVSKGKCGAALAVFRAYFDEDVYTEWAASISTVSYLHDEVEHVLQRFKSLYVYGPEITEGAERFT